MAECKKKNKLAAVLSTQCLIRLPITILVTAKGKQSLPLHTNMTTIINTQSDTIMKKCFILAWLLLPATWLLTGCSDNMETTAPEEKTTGLEPIQMECSKVQQTPFAKQSN